MSKKKKNKLEIQPIQKEKEEETSLRPYEEMYEEVGIIRYFFYFFLVGVGVGLLFLILTTIFPFI